MNKKFLILILIGVILLGGVSFFFFQNKNNQPVDDKGIILFYGLGCSHCAKVDDYLKSEKVEEKVIFEKKEVFLNKNNANLLAERVAICGLPTDSIGVPFLWDGSASKCYLGETDVINFFKAKIGG